MQRKVTRDLINHRSKHGKKIPNRPLSVSKEKINKTAAEFNSDNNKTSSQHLQISYQVDEK